MFAGTPRPTGCRERHALLGPLRTLLAASAVTTALAAAVVVGPSTAGADDDPVAGVGTPPTVTAVRPSLPATFSLGPNWSGPVDRLRERLDHAARPLCPLVGPSEFGDHWGDRRSGGRRHEGVDMVAPKGAPIVAVEAGSVNMKRSRLGGNSIWLTSDDGDEYFYAHLDRFHGDDREVERGDVIGYLGSTGNAGGPHLHFEVHPRGDGPVNPYPFAAALCDRV